MIGQWLKIREEKNDKECKGPANLGAKNQGENSKYWQNLQGKIVLLAIPISSLHMPLELLEDFCGGKPHLQSLNETFLQASRNEFPALTITHFLEKS